MIEIAKIIESDIEKSNRVPRHFHSDQQEKCVCITCEYFCECGFPACIMCNRYLKWWERRAK